MSTPKRGSRLQETFRILKRHAERKLPFSLPIKIRLCPIADKDHKETWRVFAHTMHQKNMICFAAAAEEELTNEEMAGIMAHEIGHLIAAKLGWPGHNPETPQHVQDEADRAVREILGLPLRYNKRTLEELPASSITRMIREQVKRRVRA